MALADYVFGPRIERRFEQQGLPTWTGGLLQQLLSDAALPALMGKDDIFGMSDVRGLLRWGDAMGINPDILNILGQVLPTFGDEQQRGKRENMPVFYKNWMGGREFPYVPEPEAPAAPPPGGPGMAPENQQVDSTRRGGGNFNRRSPDLRPAQPAQPAAPTAPPGFPGAGGVSAFRPSQAQVVSQGPPLPPRPGLPPAVSQSGSVRDRSTPIGGKGDGGQPIIRPPRRFY